MKEEYKQSEGDPMTRSQIRQRQVEMSRNRMMAEVAVSSVVVVNPTHVAVALEYRQEWGAPRVVAKGQGHVAARIRAEAEKHGVPIVRDVPLARTLHSACKLGAGHPRRPLRGRRPPAGLRVQSEALCRLTIRLLRPPRTGANLSRMQAVKLVLAIGWAAFWTYWLVTAFSMKRGRLPWARELRIRALMVVLVFVFIRAGPSGVTGSTRIRGAAASGWSFSPSGYGSRSGRESTSDAIGASRCRRRTTRSW